MQGRRGGSHLCFMDGGFGVFFGGEEGEARGGNGDFWGGARCIYYSHYAYGLWSGMVRMEEEEKGEGEGEGEGIIFYFDFLRLIGLRQLPHKKKIVFFLFLP